MVLFSQIYYGAKNRLHLRVIALLAVIAVNLLLLPLTARGFIMPVIVSSFLFIYISAANLFVSFSNLNRVFEPPNSYFTVLAPVPSWKILLGNIIPAALFDSIGFAVGIAGIIFNSLNLIGMTWQDNIGYEIEHIGSFLYVAASGIAMYSLVLMAFVFWKTVSKSIFFRFPVRGLFGAAAVIAALFVVNWLNSLLIPFGTVNRFWVFFSISVYPSGLNMFLVTMVTFLQAAVLLIASAYLMDRRINV